MTKLSENWKDWPPEAKLALLQRLKKRPTPQRHSTVKEIRWCPHLPTERQGIFLGLPAFEALYGGAAGGGKSDAILMAALQYVHEPNYAALILRTERAMLRLSGGLIPRSHDWLRDTPANWSGEDNRWNFPSGASISFDYLDSPDRMGRYKSSEYQFIGFEELTEFPKESYMFMRSRCRRTADNPVPLRVRSATNPGGVGHRWVKDRFISKEAEEALRDGGHGVYENVTPDGKTVAFVPAKVQDNPHLRVEEYTETLKGLTDPVLRERLLKGDWSITPDGVVKAEWFRYFDVRDDVYRLFHAPDRFTAVRIADCQRFCTVDCAGSSEDAAKEKRGKPPSYSVISTWDFHRTAGYLIWRDMVRGRWDFPDLCQQIRDAFAKHSPEFMGIEDASAGRQVLQLLSALRLRALSHEGKGKKERFGPAANELKEGKVFLPRAAAWRDDAETELVSYTGLPDEQFDIGDTMAYAAIHADRSGGGIIQLEGNGFMFGRI